MTFVNVATGGLVTLAALLTDGLGGLSAKCALVWIAALFVGALLSNAAAIFAATLLIAAPSFAQTRPLAAWRHRPGPARGWPVRVLQAAHSGLIADYVTWGTVGLAMLAAAVGR